MLILLLRLLFPLIAYDIIVWPSDRLIFSASREEEAERETKKEKKIGQGKKRTYLDCIKSRENTISHGYNKTQK